MAGPLPARSVGGVRSRHMTRQTCTAIQATLVGPRIPASSVPEKQPPKKLKGKQVEERAMRRCIALHEKNTKFNVSKSWSYPADKLEEAYSRCAAITEDYAKTFYLGTQLMEPEKARAVWAIYVWCRRTDELVDGPNASAITPKALDRWEERLEAIFEGRPYDNLDAALTDTVNKFPVDIQPFRDMVDGMRMDLVKPRYRTYEELYEYCYKVAGTVALMVMPVMGLDKNYKGGLEPVYRAALALGTANQLTNILRDVGEDIRERNRIYVPIEDLEEFGIDERELVSGLHARSNGEIDDRYKRFMKCMIDRTMHYYKEAEPGIAGLDPAARWPVWSALIVYRKILSAIEVNGYDNFTQRAYVPKAKKLLLLPFAYLCARFPSLAPQLSARI